MGVGEGLWRALSGCGRLWMMGRGCVPGGVRAFVGVRVLIERCGVVDGREMGLEFGRRKVWRGERGDGAELRRVCGRVGAGMLAWACAEGRA